MADFYERVYNPDVLSCLANLSNDEVFTPPEMANQVLDMLPEELWSDPDAKFLDPCSKTGVFLREIAKRLIRGQVPDFDECMLVIDAKRAEQEDLDDDDEAFLDRLQGVLDHIFREQLYGIGITELTSLMTRRSLYCSKGANTKYAVVTFDDEEGNIRYRNIQHTWEGKKGHERCKCCGASKKELEESRTSSETHAYELIHTFYPERLFDMQFDVVIGNPPYQLNDGGGTGSSAVPIYQKFVEQAQKLNPRYLTMIIPSRWFAGGRGLDAFREKMLKDVRISHLTDYFNSEECFPGIDLSGGVCYFLWDRDYSGDCVVTSYINGVSSTVTRPLLEDNATTFIRFNEAIGILEKVQEHGETSFQELVSANDPFGYDMRVKNSYKRIRPDIKEKPFKDCLRIHYYSKGKKQGFIARDSVRKGDELVGKTKLFMSKSYGERGSFPYLVLGKPFIGEPDEVCTETYVVIGTYDRTIEAENVMSYMATKFFRFLVMLKKNTQMATRAVYEFVPMQDFSKLWTDEELYEKYNLSSDEITFIESMIRPMDAGDDDA